MENPKAFGIVHAPYSAAQFGKDVDQMPLHLAQPIPCIFDTVFLCGNNHIFALQHIADQRGAGGQLAVLICPQIVMAVVCSMVQYIPPEHQIVHTLADNTHLDRAVRRNTGIEFAVHLLDLVFFAVRHHRIVDV